MWNCVGCWESVALVLYAVKLVHLCVIHLLLGTVNTIISVFLILIENEKKNAAVCTNIYILHSICSVNCKYTNYFIF